MDGTEQAARLLLIAQQLQALAQTGLVYNTNSYDRERYEEIRSLSARILQELTDEPLEKILRVFASDSGYQTPKVDVRAVIFRNADEILLVQEKMDGNRWTVPGGWADIGLTPFEVAAKEAREESGLLVKPVRLLALLDKQRQGHPPHSWYVYKVFIDCEVQGGQLAQETAETSGARWFKQEELNSLELSLERITPGQLSMLFELAKDRSLPAVCE